MMAPISTMPNAALKLMLCSSSSSDRLFPTGTVFICARLKQAQARPTPTANKIKTTKTHIYYNAPEPPPRAYSYPSPKPIPYPPSYPPRLLPSTQPAPCPYYHLNMEEDSKSRAQLVLAGELFGRGEWAQCRKVLGEVKAAHASNELNLLLCEYKEAPHKAAAVLKKLMDILTALNIKLYEERPKQSSGRERAPRINHELYYWNMAVVGQVAGLGEAAQLIVSEALHFTDSLRLETSLMLIYQMLNAMQSAGRLASCIALIEKQNRLLDRVRSTSKEEQTYRFINQLLFNKVLLKLGMIEGSRIMFAMRFAPSKDHDLADLTGVPLALHQQLLSAEIEYHAANYTLAAKILADLLPQLDNTRHKDLVKSMVDHNLAIILCSYRKAAPAQLLLRKSLAYFSSAKELAGNNERHSYISKCKENIVLSGLVSTNMNCSALYEAVRACSGSNSYKFNYRKAQVCLKYYHQLLANPSKVLPYKEIHDFYETVYFYPNQPYFQQKGRNKNPNFTNGRSFYRRYVLSEWENSHNDPLPTRDKEENPTEKDPKEKEVKQEPKKKDSKSANSKNAQTAKKEEEVVKEEPKEQKIDFHKARLHQVLSLAEWYLKQALAFLEKEKSIIVNLEGEEKGLTEQVNEKLYSEYIDFKASIYCLLCYVYLCKREWTKTIRYASTYQEFEKQYQLQGKSAAQQQVYYNVLTYKMEAQSELGRSHKAYDLMQDLINSIEYAESVQLQARSTPNEQHGQAYLENMSQYHNFCYNISVLHSRDNKIPETFQAIQKILQMMRVSPSSPQANLPMSLVELLVHYNLRTGNNPSALQMIKRRRILNTPGVIPQYQPTLNVTK